MKKTYAISMGMALGMMAGWANGEGGNPAEELLRLERPLVIAHRGYSELAPENTLASFRMGITSGADLIELDYHVSAEGKEIVIHDETLDRTTDAILNWGRKDLPVRETALEDMQSLDAGTWFAKAYTGERLPTLVEALELIQGNGGMTLIERKAGPASSCAEILKDNGWVNAVIVQSFDWNYLTELHELLPEQVLGALGPAKERNGKKLSRNERQLDKDWIDAAKASGARVVGWNRYVGKEAVAYAHEQDMEVWIYTINTQSEACKFLEMGVDGIITNNPSIVWKALALLEQ